MTFKIIGTSKLVLIQKYKSEGWPDDKIKKHIKFLNNHFDNLEIELRNQKKSEKYIQTRFMEDFNKLCSG